MQDYIGDIMNYMHEEMDNDYRYYLFKDNDVKPFRNENKQLRAIIDQIKSEITKGYYIKGNYIFFTLNGLKYYELLGHFEEEWWNIDKYMQLLRDNGAENVAYCYGDLD